MISISSAPSCSIRPVEIKHEGLNIPPVNAVGRGDSMINTCLLFPKSTQKTDLLMVMIKHNYFFCKNIETETNEYKQTNTMPTQEIENI